MIRLSVLIGIFMVSGCASISSQRVNTNQYDIDSLLNDTKFPYASSIQIESKEEIFALSDEMTLMVKNLVATERIPRKKAKKLIKHIFNPDDVGLAYQSNANLTASQAYKNKIANCLSLTIMAYALLEEADLHARFQEVEIPEYWVRNGRYNMLTGHVNLVISDFKQPDVSVVWGSDDLEIDFDPFIRKKRFPKRIIDVKKVIAMFYNNKGAEALINDQLDKAYRYFIEAIKVSPKFSASWANLGILYRFTHQNELAEKAYRHALNLEPSGLNTMSNLSLLLHRKGNFDDARALDSRILKERRKNPYYHALLADEALFIGNTERAIRHYKRAIKLNSKVHEFHFGLAKAFLLAGRLDLAKLAMKKAINVNRTPNIEKTYLAKLNLLQGS